VALTARQRRALPKSTFALSGGTKGSKAPAFPMPDKKHARAAISGATRSANAGNISTSQASMIKAKARAQLGINARKNGK
jgi:hypothetical protein